MIRLKNDEMRDMFYFFMCLSKLFLAIINGVRDICEPLGAVPELLKGNKIFTSMRETSELGQCFFCTS